MAVVKHVYAKSNKPSANKPSRAHLTVMISIRHIEYSCTSYLSFWICRYSEISYLDTYGKKMLYQTIESLDFSVILFVGNGVSARFLSRLPQCLDYLLLTLKA